MRRLFVGTLVAVALSGCASSTSPDLAPDPSLSFDTAYARWTAVAHTNYAFEFDQQGSWVPSPGFIRATVTDGRLTDLHLVDSHEVVPLTAGFTIDQLWGRLIAARASGESLAELQFSRDGVPIQAMVGSFANDGGVFYRVRSFEQNR
jgi:hypothetical protein